MLHTYIWRQKFIQPQNWYALTTILPRDLEILPSGYGTPAGLPGICQRRHAARQSPESNIPGPTPTASFIHASISLERFCDQKVNFKPNASWGQAVLFVLFAIILNPPQSILVALPAPHSCLFSLKFEKTPKNLPDSFLLISIFFFSYLFTTLLDSPRRRPIDGSLSFKLCALSSWFSYFAY